VGQTDGKVDVINELVVNVVTVEVSDALDNEVLAVVKLDVVDIELEEVVTVSEVVEVI